MINDIYDAAHLMVALTNSDIKKALASAALARKSLEGISEKYQEKIAALWDDANEEALKHLNVVIKNNPHKPIADILKRPDVQSAIRWPYEQAAKASEPIMKEAWDEAAKDALQKAKGEVKLLGGTWGGHEIDDTLLTDLIEDLHLNAKAMKARIETGLKGKDPETRLKQITSDVRTRGAFTASTGVWGVASMVRDSAAALAGINKMWLSRMDAATCSGCRGLHMVVVGPGQTFPNPFKGTYKDRPLLGPPLHPRCRCVAVLTKLKKTKNKNSKS